MATTTVSTTATVTAPTVTLKARGSQPQQQPQFPDVNTIRKAIPAHCFQPSAVRSLAYVARDLAMSGALVWAAVTYIHQLPNVYARTAAWMAYGYAQGLVCTGIWILAHECGHGAFSLHRRLNDFVGWALHSYLMVPFFSWKFSHARHHKYTGHMEKDMAFVPATKEEHEHKLKTQWWHSDLVEDVPAFVLLKLIGHQLFAWPAYLLFNLSSGPNSLQGDKTWYRISHFDPLGSVFRPSEAIYVFLSDVGLAITSYGLYRAAQVLDAPTVFLLYAVPWFWVHHFLIAITYLHHHHEDVPHYSADSWEFVKGALATVDRDFGWIDKHLFHCIISHHVSPPRSIRALCLAAGVALTFPQVVHHLFSKIPFYYAGEATEAIKPMLGDLYHEEKGSFYGHLWSSFKNLKYVESDPASPGTMRWAGVKRS